MNTFSIAFGIYAALCIGFCGGFVIGAALRDDAPSPEGN